MLRAFKISPLLLFGFVSVIAIGDVAAGTSVYFSTMVAITLLSIGVSYNMLGGVARLGGIVFAVASCCWVVVSQIAKVALFQPADSKIEAPQLTITVYAVFFASAMVGIFMLRDVHLKVPRPLEPESESHAKLLYAVALPAGIVGEVLFNLTNVTYGAHTESESQMNGSHAAGVALQALLLFALVLAIDIRIRKTNGRHSFSLAAFIPWVATAIGSFINTERIGIVAPTILYLVTCYFRGYRFRRRHYIAVVAGLALFVLVISPLELFTRDDIRDLGFQDRAYMAFHVATTANWAEVKAVEDEAPTGGMLREDYFGLPGSSVLNRFSRIRTDSNLIGSTANYHYGFAGIKTDLLREVPHFLLKDKPERDSADFLGRVSGMSGDIEGNTEPAFTMVGDSFGAFSWIGVVFTGAFLLPFILMMYESMFQMHRPWGTVALISCLIAVPEGGLGRLISSIALRTPIYLLLFSYGIGLITKALPVRADSSVAALPEAS